MRTIKKSDKVEIRSLIFIC